MYRQINIWLQVFFLLTLTACSNNELLEKLENIQKVGDNNPEVALNMLDSLEIRIRKQPEDVQAKFDLLKIRIADKANIEPKSDVIIKQLLEYFQSTGNTLEKQEVYYYAGSTYRDLKDTPRALKYFLESKETVFGKEDCDSLMLRNTYSNLSVLYYGVQNFREAAVMAKKELEISRQLRKELVLPFLHLGSAYLGFSDDKLTNAALDSAFTYILHSKDISQYQDYLPYLLCHYSEIGNLSKAQKCIPLIATREPDELSSFSCIAFAQYYEASGKTDSAIMYCKRVLNNGTSLSDKYDASKLLYTLYTKKGNRDDTFKAAALYMQLSDSLDFGKRQEMSATIHNAYQYHLDQNEEQKLKDAQERDKIMIIFVLLLTAVFTNLAYILYVRKKNRHLREIINLSSELKHMSDAARQLHMIIENKEKELVASQNAMQKVSDELDSTKYRLQCVNSELTDYATLLKEKEHQLSEKMKQNQSLIRLLNQSKLEFKANDVIQAIRQSAEGKKEMSAMNWTQLYRAVDELDPSFKETILQKMDTFNDSQMQVCYLMRIGLSANKIKNMTDVSRSTIWRWMNKYDWIQTLDAIGEKTDKAFQGNGQK